MKKIIRLPRCLIIFPVKRWSHPLYTITNSLLLPFVLFSLFLYWYFFYFFFFLLLVLQMTATALHERWIISLFPQASSLHPSFFSLPQFLLIVLRSYYIPSSLTLSLLSKLFRSKPLASWNVSESSSRGLNERATAALLLSSMQCNLNSLSKKSVAGKNEFFSSSSPLSFSFLSLSILSLSLFFVLPHWESLSETLSILFCIVLNCLWT